MTRKYLSPQDAAFVRMESLRAPMHVGALLTFRMPGQAPRDFLRDLLSQMRSQPFMPPPFDSRLSRSRLGRLLPAWETTGLDIDYHIRHSALPYPGGERELGVLVARLHSHPMDLTRPLWECHLIEGLEDHRFALYFKAHHCAIDGMGAMNLVRSWLSEDPNDPHGPAVDMPKPAAEGADSGVSDDGSRGNLIRRMADLARNNARSVSELVQTIAKLSQGGEESVIRAAMHTPRTLFNVPITQQRRLGTQILQLSRLKAVTAATGTTINDVSLAIVGGAARRYLKEHNALPDKSLTASVPIGLPRKDGKPGNAVTGFVCPLGTQVADPRRRLDLIHAVTSRTKEQMLSMSPTALEQFALLGMSPLILGQMAGVLARFPPFFNFVVSNVVLTKHKLYLRGAELEAMYPVSFLFDGYALNVTIVGYADRVAVGFIGCRDAIPSLQRLAVYTGEALTELEEAVGISHAKKKKKIAASLSSKA